MPAELAQSIDLAAVRARHPKFFVNPWRQRAKGLAVIFVMAAVYVGAFIYFDVPWARLGENRERRTGSGTNPRTA